MNHSNYHHKNSFAAKAGFGRNLEYPHSTCVFICLGFPAVVVIVRNNSSLVFAAIRTGYNLTKYLLSRNSGKLLVRSCFPSSGKPAPIGPILLRKDYVENMVVWARKGDSLPHKAFELTNQAVRTVSYFVYSIVSTSLVFLIDFSYLYGKVLAESFFNLLKGCYVAGYDYLVNYFGQLSDGFIIVYTLIFGFALLYVSFKLLRQVYHILYNVYALFLLLYQSTMQFVESVRDRTIQDRSRLYETVSKFVANSPLAKLVTVEHDHNMGKIFLAEIYNEKNENSNNTEDKTVKKINNRK